jgi:hypothetical protein
MIKFSDIIKTNNNKSSSCRWKPNVSKMRKNVKLKNLETSKKKLQIDRKKVTLFVLREPLNKVKGTPEIEKN